MLDRLKVVIIPSYYTYLLFRQGLSSQSASSGIMVITCYYNYLSTYGLKQSEVNFKSYLQ
jgi:hypothetical protein